MDKLQDLKVSGMSKMGGGKFDLVDISGMGTIYGDLEANKMNISGMAKVEGNIKVNQVDIEGCGDIQGDVECDQFRNSGTVKVTGKLKAELFKTKGVSKVGESIKAKEVILQGTLNVGGDVEAEKFESEGSFKIGGLLNANSINIKVGYGGAVREIGGEEILIKKAGLKSTGFPIFLISISKCLKTDLIEGTHISIDYVIAKTVRGENIKIGPKSHIGLVEYSGTLEVDPGAKVGETRKIE